jgi:hypothetical protein
MTIKPYDTFEDIGVEIRGFDPQKPDRLIWRCTKEQASDLSKIIEMVKAQGYEYFEVREITVINRLYDINEEESND